VLAFKPHRDKLGKGLWEARFIFPIIAAAITVIIVSASSR